MIQGLELARQYYEAYGKGMIEEQFPQLADRIAIGLVGQGSECFGFDDEISMDHDYGPSFCMWLTEADYRQYGKALAEAYERLPKDFMGVPGRIVSTHGGGRVGVHETHTFYYGLLGTDTVPATAREWLYLPESRLAAVTNGAVFRDDLGEFSAFRNALLAYYPEDVRIKKIAARAAVMAQSGQYNYARLMKRRETTAAEMALAEFIKHTISMVYLLNRRYTPFYKWMHRGMRELPLLSDVSELLTMLAETPCQKEAWEGVKPMDYLYQLNSGDKKVVIIEVICGMVVEELARQGLTTMQDGFLEAHTAEIMSHIKDDTIRSMHVMEG